MTNLFTLNGSKAHARGRMKVIVERMRVVVRSLPRGRQLVMAASPSFNKDQTPSRKRTLTLSTLERRVTSFQEVLKARTHLPDLISRNSVPTRHVKRLIARKTRNSQKGGDRTRSIQTNRREGHMVRTVRNGRDATRRHLAAPRKNTPTHYIHTPKTCTSKGKMAQKFETLTNQAGGALPHRIRHAKPTQRHVHIRRHVKKNIRRTRRFLRARVLS